MKRVFLALLLVIMMAPKASAALFRREVLVLIDENTDLALRGDTLPVEMETILNHLGLIVRYHDVRTGLPSPALSRRVRGVISLLDGNEMPRAQTYARWFDDRIKSGQRLLFFGGLGFLADSKTGSPVPPELCSPIFQDLGIRYEGAFVDDPSKLAIAYRSPQTHFERKWQRPPAFYEQVQSINPANTVFFRLRRTDTEATSDMGAVGPHGAWLLDMDYLAYMNPISFHLQWKIDPFWLLSHGLGLSNEPRIDTTTVNGRRIFYAHIDGDGFTNVAHMRGRPYASEVIRDQVLKKTWLPTTASVIVREIIGHPKFEAIARSIFALPNVQAGSHSYTHPENWETGAMTAGDIITDGGETKQLEVHYEHLSPRHEVDDSVHFIDTLLPPGHHVDVIQWSGETNPTAPFLQRTYALGIANINGGDAKLSLSAPSYANLSPLARQVGPYLQVYSSDANENLFSNLWTGPFDGFKKVIKTFEFAGSPRRMAPVNIYYHYYSGERVEGVKALQYVYGWAEKQPLTPITTAHYARIVDGFYSGIIHSEGPWAWKVEHLGACRTLRFDGVSKTPDLAASREVAGYNRFHDSLYVHLASDSALVVLSDKPQLQPYLEEASAPLVKWKRKGDAISATFDAVAPMEVTLAGFSPHQPITWKGDFHGPAQADRQGKLCLEAAMGVRSLEARW